MENRSTINLCKEDVFKSAGDKCRHRHDHKHLHKPSRLVGLARVRVGAVPVFRLHVALLLYYVR
jgi:hypothetical protein